MVSRVYDNIKSSLLNEADRWVLWLPVFFGFGIALYFSLPDEPSLNFAIALVIGSAALFAVSHKKFALRMASLCLVFVVLGFASGKINTDLAEAPIFPGNKDAITISGNIVSISYSGDFPSLVLENLRIDEIDQKYLPKKIRLNVRTKFKEPVRPGDRIITDAILSSPGRPAIPGEYDFAKFAYFDQVGAKGFAVKKIVKLKVGTEDSYIENLRYTISEKIRESVPGDAGAMTDAIVTGDRSRISKEAYNDMRKSGLAHLIAISGINLVLAGGVMFFGFRSLMSLSYRFGERFPVKKLAAVAAILGETFYLLISGVQVSAVRSFIMVMLIMIGVVLDRAATPMRSVAFSALIILAFAPVSMLGPSFQMSYAATIALISVYEIFSKRFASKEDKDLTDDGKVKWHKRLVNKIWLYPLTVIGSSLVAGLATAPFSAYHFSQFVNYGLLANLIAVPLTSLIVMPFLVIGLVLMPVGLQNIGLVPAGWANYWILQVANKIGNLPNSAVYVSQIPSWGLAVMTMGGLWFLLWQTRWRYYGFILIVIGLISPLTFKLPDIMINETGKLFAINRDGKLYLSNMRNSFASKAWLQYFAQGDKLKLEKADSYDVKGHSFAMACQNQPGFSVSPGLCITYEELQKQGTHNIYLSAGKITVETVEEKRGNRPWTKE